MSDEQRMINRLIKKLEHGKLEESCEDMARVIELFSQAILVCFDELHEIKAALTPPESEDVH